MGTPIVTIGGKVVYPAPDVARDRARAVIAPGTSDIRDPNTCQRGRMALFFGLAAAVGLLVLLLVWIARRDRTAA